MLATPSPPKTTKYGYKNYPLWYVLSQGAAKVSVGVTFLQVSVFRLRIHNELKRCLLAEPPPKIMTSLSI